MSVGVPVTKSFNKLKKYPYEINKFDRRETNEYFYLPVDCPRMKKCDDAYCPLAHTKLEKIFHPIVYKTQACQMAKDGACDYFQKCAFYHDSNDKNEAHLNWTIWEKKWNKWRNNIDSILTHHNKNDKEIRRKVESILKIRMPHFNYNSNKNGLFLNKNASFYSTWSNSSQGGGVSSGNKMSNVSTGLGSGLNNLLCSSINASITHCPTTMFNSPWNSKQLSSVKKSIKNNSDGKSCSNNNGSSIWINELSDLGTLTYDKTTDMNTSFMNKSNMYYDDTLSYNSNTTDCGLNFDMLDNNAYKVVEFCFTDYENNKTKGGWRENCDVMGVQGVNSFFSHGLKGQEGETKAGLSNVGKGSGTVAGEGSCGAAQESNPFQQLTYNKACEYFPSVADMANGKEGENDEAYGMNANVCNTAQTNVHHFKDELITSMGSSPEGNFDLIGSKYFSNNSNNTSIFENYGNLSTIFDASENNNKANSFANMSYCKTFDNLSFGDTCRSGVNNSFFTNEHVEEGQGCKVDVEDGDVGGSVTGVVDTGRGEMTGVNRDKELKQEQGDRKDSVTLTGNNTKGQNKMSKKNKNKKGGDANLANNNGSRNSSNALNAGSNTRTSTFSEILCAGNNEMKSELNEKRKNSKKENQMSKNCNNEQDPDDKKSGSSKFLSAGERNDEDFSSAEQSCVEREKGKSVKGKNGEGQGGKKGSNTPSTNKSGNKNSKKGTTTESASNGGTPRGRKQVESDHRESDQREGTEQEKGEREQKSGKEVEVGSHANDHAFRDKARKDGNGSERSRSSAVNGRDVSGKGSSSCSGVTSMNQAKITCEELSAAVCTSSRGNFDWAHRNQDTENKKQNNVGTTFSSLGGVQSRGVSIDINNGANSYHGVMRTSTTESSVNNDNHMEDKRQLEESCGQTMNYSHCTENSVPSKEPSEFVIANKQLVKHKDSMFYNYARGSMDSKLAELETFGGRNGVRVVGDNLFGRKRNNSAFILKEREDQSRMSLQGVSGGMGDDLGSIFNLGLNMGNTFRESRGSAFKEGRSSSFNEGRSSSFSMGGGNPFREERGKSFGENNLANDTYSNFFIKEEAFHPVHNKQFEEVTKTKEYNTNEKEVNEPMDYTNNLLNIFLSCNSINENFECTNESDNRFTDFKEDTNLFGHKEKEVTHGREFFNSSSHNFNPFGNYYNFLGPSCLQCKHYKNEIKNLMVQIKILRQELLKCKQIIMASGLNGGNDNKMNPCNYNWTNTKSLSDMYEKKNFVSSIEAND
ncbi:hypothetical protein AK88_01380 [Plasmodium fragile]|uniref:C3H1-type domain-containing protein n=1 Tax=Plasmodium fragile TaxID=5857 RepID=A0A0D9QTA8_PLAFR|nr:uncharacterized protein AK88_01380 [Plasmodium fragile]KJP88886.1 hypothetical protein AK88_01380 [Plasmodium fragile]